VAGANTVTVNDCHFGTSFWNTDPSAGGAVAINLENENPDSSNDGSPNDVELIWIVDCTLGDTRQDSRDADLLVIGVGTHSLRTLALENLKGWTTLFNACPVELFTNECDLVHKGETCNPQLGQRPHAFPRAPAGRTSARR
jgi:hypothetical protein